MVTQPEHLKEFEFLGGYFSQNCCASREWLAGSEPSSAAGVRMMAAADGDSWSSAPAIRLAGSIAYFSKEMKCPPVHSTAKDYL